MPYPKISIIFCTKCRWNLRSAWYLQELLQTFGDQIAEISMIPGASGEFRIIGQLHNNEEPLCIWDRKIDNGFPDSKFLKQRVKKLLFDDKVSIGNHNERTKPKESIAKVSVQSHTLISEDICPDCNA